MKSEIDALMKKEGIDAFLITGACMHNPFMVYLAGGTYHVSHADLVKIWGHEGVMVHNDMERDEAAKTGFNLRSLSQLGYPIIKSKTQNDEMQAIILLYEKLFNELNLTTGRVAIFGEIDLGKGFAIFNALQARFPNLQFIGTGRDNFLTDAMQTKDADEVEHIRKMGLITTQVVGRTADYLTSQRVKNGILVKKNGEPLTIGDVRKKINLWLAENGAESPEGTIFAIGQDAGVPHSMGNDPDAIETGKTIVFDIYPCEAGGGYFYDFTRTWCLGFAPDEVLKAYEDVKTIYNQLINALKPGMPLFDYQQMTCSYFESKGHATSRTNPGGRSGYVHSISHGLGLHIHEKPFTGISNELSDKLLANTIFTVEPGLYYPEKGFGIRIEDTYWTRPDGRFERLAEFQYDLILPVT